MSSGDEDEKGGGSGSFADLIGETKPINRGPVRVERAASGSKAFRPLNSPEANTPTSTFRWPDPLEPRLAAAPGVSDSQILALGRGEPEPEEIALHRIIGIDYQDKTALLINLHRGLGRKHRLYQCGLLEDDAHILAR